MFRDVLTDFHAILPVMTVKLHTSDRARHSPRFRPTVNDTYVGCLSTYLRYVDPQPKNNHFEHSNRSQVRNDYSSPTIDTPEKTWSIYRQLILYSTAGLNFHDVGLAVTDTCLHPVISTARSIHPPIRLTMISSKPGYRLTRITT